MPKNQITGYPTSKDYCLLIDLARKQQVICLVENGQSVARTLYLANDLEEIFSIGVPGTGYVYACGADDFITQCHRFNIEFLIPEGECPPPTP